MLDVLSAIVAFIVAIGVLVAIHEYGHFWVARRLGFKVLRFSVGFGKPLLRWRESEGANTTGRPRQLEWVRGPVEQELSAAAPTEYWLSSIPLGGYVKLLDEREAPVPGEDAHLAFNRRPIPHRIAVLLAGPGFNFLFAIVAYWLMFVTGVPGIKAIVGPVMPDTVASEAGLRAGDEIIAVGDRPTATWEGAVLGILDELLADGVIDLTVQDADGRSRYVDLDVRGRESELTEPEALFAGLGFDPGPVRPAVLGDLSEGYAAVEAGLQKGDRVLELDGQRIERFSELVGFVRDRPGQLVSVVVDRDGRELTFEMEIGDVPVEGGAPGERRGLIGAGENTDVLRAIAADASTTERYGLFAAIPKGIEKTWEMSELTVRMLGRMVTGDVSVRNISGPINIANYAGDSARAGLGAFLSFLSVVSISLGILNLLPVPLLDGGQIVYQLAEAVKGSPISERSMIFGQQVGLLLLVVLMSFAFYNDISRIFG